MAPPGAIGKFAWISRPCCATCAQGMLACPTLRSAGMACGNARLERGSPAMGDPTQEQDEFENAAPLQAEAVRLPERHVAIDRRKALIAGATLWCGFALVAWLFVTGRMEAFDRFGLMLYRTGDDLAF